MMKQLSNIIIPTAYSYSGVIVLSHVCLLLEDVQSLVNPVTSVSSVVYIFVTCIVYTQL